MSSEDNAPARITNQMIYATLVDVKETVIKLVEHSDAQAKTLEKHDEKIDANQKDISSLREEVRVFKGRVALAGLIGFPVFTALISAGVGLLLK